MKCILDCILAKFGNIVRAYLEINVYFWSYGN